MMSDLKKLCKSRGLTVTAVIGEVVDNTEVQSENVKGSKSRIESITILQYQGRIMSTNYIFGDGAAYRAASPSKKEKLGRVKPEDVIYSLLVDAEVLSYTTFEDWAGSYGYDLDSRKAFACYEACLRSAHHLKTLLKDDLKDFQEASQDA
jgi:hypothetical protein